MDRSQLLQHFDTLAETPDAVAKLRKLVMELGVQGRLVPQQREDGDALAVLNKIDAERARRVAAKELEASPRMKTVAPPATKLPSGWVWSPFGRVSFCRDGERIPVNSDDREGLAKTYDYYGASGVIDKIDRYLFDKPLLLIGEDGANLVNRSTPIAFIAEGKYWVNNHAHVLDAIDRTLLEYLRIYINSINLEPYLTGMAQPKMNQAQMNSIPIALPPLAEQRRIVAKVEELLTLCDELEARQTAAREHRTRLVRSSLDHLTTAQDESDFKKHSAFCLQHSELLFDSVPALRQAILSLAVQGRLVPPTGKAIAVAPHHPPEVIAPIQCPAHWRWARLETLLSFGPSNGLSPKPVSFSTKTRALTLTATTSGTFRADCFKYIAQEVEPDSDLWLRAGDILLQRGNSLDYVGIAALYEGADCQFIYPDLMIKIRVSDSVDARFAHLVLNSPFGREFFQSRATGTSGSMPKINQGVIRSFPFPVVPLPEQQRIVAKVDELLCWCDALEARLTAARTTATHLLDAILHQILNPAGQGKP